MKKALLIAILILGISGLVFAQEKEEYVTYSVKVPTKYVEFLELKAKQDNITVEKLLQKAAIIVANNVVQKLYEYEMMKKPVDEKISELKAKGVIKSTK